MCLRRILQALIRSGTTALVTRNYAAMVFETLYGRDEQLDPQPQMVEGHQMDDNGLRWTMRLRDGLAFHDGERCWRAIALPHCNAG